MHAGSGQQNDRPEPLAPLLGASLLSAAGSLPLHLSPFIATALVAGDIASLGQAGWARSASQLGELVAALALPLLGVGRIGRSGALLGGVLLGVGFLVAATDGLGRLVAGWLLVGAACGLLKYLGTLAAAGAGKRTFAFSLRLALVLLAAGLAAVYLLVSGTAGVYADLLVRIGVVTAGLTLCGLLLYAPRAAVTPAAIPPAAAPRRPFRVEASGLAVLLLYFVGLSGVLVYALHQARLRGLGAEEAAWSLALAKLAASAWLLAQSRAARSREPSESLLGTGVLLAGATGLVYLASDALTFFAGLLLWEVAMNSQSARLQAAVVTAAPALAGRWLNAAILAGGVTGPLLNGVMLGLGAGWAYLASGLAAIALSVLWAATVGASRRPPAA